MAPRPTIPGILPRPACDGHFGTRGGYRTHSADHTYLRQPLSGSRKKTLPQFPGKNVTQAGVPANWEPKPTSYPTPVLGFTSTLHPRPYWLSLCAGDCRTKSPPSKTTRRCGLLTLDCVRFLARTRKHPKPPGRGRPPTEEDHLVFFAVACCCNCCPACTNMALRLRLYSPSFDWLAILAALCGRVAVKLRASQGTSPPRWVGRRGPHASAPAATSLEAIHTL